MTVLERLPCPKQVEPAKWDEYEPIIRWQLDILSQAGITVNHFDVDSPTLYNYLWVDIVTPWGTIPTSVNLNSFVNLTDKQLQAFVSIFPEFLSVVQQMIAGRSKEQTFFDGKFTGDIFYSDISQYLKPYDGYACRHLLFSLACSLLNKAKVWVHS